MEFLALDTVYKQLNEEKVILLVTNCPIKCTIIINFKNALICFYVFVILLFISRYKKTGRQNTDFPFFDAVKKTKFCYFCRLFFPDWIKELNEQEMGPKQVKTQKIQCQQKDIEQRDTKGLQRDGKTTERCSHVICSCSVCISAWVRGLLSHNLSINTLYIFILYAYLSLQEPFHSTWPQGFLIRISWTVLPL